MQLIHPSFKYRWLDENNTSLEIRKITCSLSFLKKNNDIFQQLIIS